MPIRFSHACLMIALAGPAAAPAQEAADATWELWPAGPPGGPLEIGPEHDATGPDGRLVGGRRVMRITDVSTPTLSVFKAPEAEANGTAVIVCPGGGFRVLAWDLEGTEVASWLNSLGVTAAVLKYRVPARDQAPERRWLDAVQDAQRAVGLLRSRAEELGVDPDRVGILGFSAGGQTAGMAALLGDRQYEAVDAIDEAPCRPDFAVLIYPGGFHDRESGAFPDHVRVTGEAPPVFLVHADDDGLSSENSVRLYLELKRAGVPAELHVYASGGHGFGLRATPSPATTWPARCAEWLVGRGLLASSGGDGGESGDRPARTSRPDRPVDPRDLRGGPR